MLKIEFAFCGFVQITRGLRAGHLSRQACNESAWRKLTPDGTGHKAPGRILQDRPSMDAQVPPTPIAAMDIWNGAA